ncbi:MAG TPA: ATP-dependent DNA helicase RecG [Burkholderiales bacterium]|nr:ATP-dependent DNA helicase RecG [Burkholderiales bacterium]
MKATLRATAAAPEAPDKTFARLSDAVRERLAKLGIHRPFDLVLHLPLRYDDETHLYPIAAAPPAQPVLIEGEIVESGVQFRPRRQLVCHIADGSGVATLRFLNFYPSQSRQLAAGRRVRAFGELRQGFFGAEMVHPRYRMVTPDMPLAETLTPVYPTTAGLGQDALRTLVQRALAAADLNDTLPPELITQQALLPFADSVRYLHHPPPDASRVALEERTHPAWRRIKFDELLAQQLSMRLHQRERRTRNAPSLKARDDLTQRLLTALPFRLTRAQQKVLAEIRQDLTRPHPMQRLLQGDVGSGKTVVAALAALQAIENGCQVAVMAPTEILAEQHHRKLTEWLDGLDVEIAWLAGSLTPKQKKAAAERIASGAAMIAIGTHALIQEQVTFRKLGLVIVDEQHRFGVHQRLQLRVKGTRRTTQPHQLMMSATPIPRTLAMSYYADLDVSVIDELPPGRTPVVTKLVSDSRRAEVVQRVRDACLGGSQAYWVCPLIEESETLQLKTALETYETLRQTFPELAIGLVHGRMKGVEKAQAMAAFQSGATQLLVATTVIEVGVDVPNATLMVIEHAERMGLSQLHQLRGRVGRGAGESACILLYQSPLTATARMRLRIIFENHDGFEIARHDLKLRGPGELLGARQSGVPLLRFADLETDLDLLDTARAAAEHLLREHPAQAAGHVARWLGEKHDYLRV